MVINYFVIYWLRILKGRIHAMPEDYLAAIGKEKQVMQYYKPKLRNRQSYKSKINKCSEMKINQEIRV